MSPHIFITATGTELGKTTLSQALVHAGHQRTYHTLPYKLAQSGTAGEVLDSQRLEASYRLHHPRSTHDLSCFTYDRALAPGLVTDPEWFTATPKPSPARQANRHTSLEQACQKLQATTQELQPDLVVIEGAGGLHVPMPGGTWLLEWIEKLATHILIAIAPGLGTINHSILTIEALMHRGLPVTGFIVVHSQPNLYPHTQQNIAVISRHTEIPCLGELPYLRDDPSTSITPDQWTTAELWQKLQDAPDTGTPSST